MKFASRCVHPEANPESNHDPYRAVAPPLYQTATFIQPGALEFGPYDYTRSGNPTRALLERQLAALEGGTHGLAFASGLAALTAATRLLRPGDELLAGDDLYGGTVRLCEQMLRPYGIAVHYADPADLKSFAAAFTPRVKLVVVESPTNPLLRIADLRALAALCHARGARLLVDNSCLSPVLQNPLALGADIVLHSATKFLGGHSDVTAGALVTNDTELHARLAFQQNAEGAGLAPFEAWLLLRGLKTLDIRVKAQCRAAMKIAKFLNSHPAVKQVYYPGLQTHPGYAIHRTQASGAGALLSFTTGDPEFARRLVEACKLFTIAVSFGSVHSVITLPGRMSHASIPDELRGRLAPPPDLVRLSIGIEDAAELRADLRRAFKVAAGKITRSVVVRRAQAA